MNRYWEMVTSLPQKLNQQEQSELLKKYYETRDENIRQKLIEHNLRLVANCADYFKESGIDLNDLFAIGTIELINVLDNKYDISRGVAFSTYATSCIRFRMLRELHISDRSSDFLDHNELRVDVENIQQVNNIVDEYSNDLRYWELLEDKSVIEQFLKKLDESDRYLLEYRFGINGKQYKTCSELAKECGCSVMLISYKTDALLKRFRHYFANGTKHGKKDVDVTVEDVEKYIFVSNNLKEVEIAEYLYGLNGKSKLRIPEIAAQLGLPYREAYRCVACLHKKIINIKNYGLKRSKYNFLKKQEVYEYYNSCTSEKEKILIEYRYGINGVEKKSSKQVAELMQVCPATASKLYYELESKIFQFVNEKDESAK